MLVTVLALPSVVMAAPVISVVAAAAVIVLLMKRGLTAVEERFDVCVAETSVALDGVVRLWNGIAVAVMIETGMMLVVLSGTAVEVR